MSNHTTHQRKSFFGRGYPYRFTAVSNNRKATLGRCFRMERVGKRFDRIAKVFMPERKFPEQKKQPYVGVADFGAMRRGYHLNRGPKA